MIQLEGQLPPTRLRLAHILDDGVTDLLNLCTDRSLEIYGEAEVVQDLRDDQLDSGKAPRNLLNNVKLNLRDSPFDDADPFSG